jgi:hypothetical protein
LIYRHSSIIDTDVLLGEKLVNDAQEGSQPQNCATAALKYALEQLGVPVGDLELADLVNEPNNSTNLRDIKYFVQDLGLNCRAIQANFDTIRDLSNCQIILYLPGKKHFVVLESIDSDYVRLIDMASRKFYDRVDISFFDMDWPTGVAFIISNNTIQGDLVDIAENELGNIVGASGYSCTRLIQQYSYVLCQYVAEECLGYYTIYWERWGCEAAENGTCSSDWFYRLSKTPCIEDIYDPFNCTVTGDFTDYWMRACA